MPGPPWYRRGPLARLLPEERLLLAVIAVAVSACLATGTGFTVQRVLDGYDNLFALNLVFILVASRVVLSRRASRPSSGYYQLIDLGAEISILRAMGFVLAYITVYTNLKARIPIFNGATHDAELRAFEQAIFLGADPVDWARTLRHHWDFAAFLDRVYHHDYLFMTLSTAMLFINNGPRHVRHLVTAMGFMYLIGVTTTIAWPTLGPCFVNREAYTWMDVRDLESWASQEFLQKYYEVSVDRAADPAPISARAFSGIAAFPSLHVAHCLLLTRFAWTYHRRLVWVFAPVTALTTLATLVFGWHYLLDGLVAPLLVAVSWSLSRRVIFGNEPFVVQDRQ
jgi:hypothetical protein